MNIRHTAARVAAAVFMCLALCFSSWVAAASADDIAEMKRAIEALQAQNRAIEALQAENRALAKRVATLEAEKSRREQAAQDERAQKKEEAESQPIRVEGKERVESREQERLEQRVKELEMAKTAQEDATRSIIRDALSKTGSKINESVTLGGTLEVTAGRSKDFSGASQSTVELSTAEFDFEVQVNEWTLANLVVEYVSGTDVLFPTTTGFQTGVDRINLDTAFLTVGDPQRFPPFVRAGRMILPFGISTGNPVADVLSIENPLTIEAFETRKTAIGLGLGFPTPALTPATPPVIPPPVKPLAINPLISSLSRHLGYAPPPTRPKPPTPITLTPAPPLFNAGIYFYNGNTLTTPDNRPIPSDHISATMGFRTKGHCGRPYYELRGADLCPWSIDVAVDYNSSVFDSRFLEAEYEGFLDQIGFVPGMAASVKSTLGPVALIGEWNGAINRARFVDGQGNSVSIKPAAWQLSLGYQFDWNPWVESIGAQGTFLAIGYSESRDLAGVTQLINGEPIRVGAVPKRRLILTGGEWVLDGLKLALEFSRNWDYSKNEGGTGNSANGIFTALTYVW
jgi:cell division protein FtsB